MAELVKVEMLRALGGYAEGDERELSPGDAKRLEARGVVRIIKAKAEPTAPRNKAEPAPRNKAEPKLTNKAAG